MALRCYTGLGPYIAVLKTHIDILSDFGPETIQGLTTLAQQHDFLIFEDRKFIDIGNTVQKQYKGGALRIHEWAHIVNASILAGEGIIQALDQIVQDGSIPDRGILILAEMTSKGSLAVGEYTRMSVEIARKYPQSVMGFVSTKELSSHSPNSTANEDFVVFTTGVNISSKGDSLGQQYQTPTTAMEGGSDFLIAGRGIYAAADPIAAVKEYQSAGWDAYKQRSTSSS
jgi:orotidine-5'-phosphate decarboxylase